MKRKIAWLLSFLILSMIVSSCAGDNSVDSENIGNPNSSEVTDTDPANFYEPDNLPSLDYGGATVTMFVRGDSPLTEFYVEEQTGDIVDDAIYERNLKVSERLNVKFSFREEPGAYENRITFAEKLTASIMAGDNAYDIVAGYSMAVANLASAGILLNLAESKYLDFSKPWWSESLLTETMLNGKLYFASGDISTHLIYMMFATFFNKTLLADNQLENPYELVFSGKWTLDKLIEMTNGVYSDLNGNGIKDEDDRFGFRLGLVYIDSFYFASGMRTTEIGTEGKLSISPDYNGEKIVALIEKLNGFIHNSPDTFFVPTTETVVRFYEGNALFANLEIQFAHLYLRDADFNYGILPVPKYDENQENYYTIASFPYMLYGVPLDAVDFEMSSAVMEALASEGYRTVSPALFETALKVKYTSDDDASKVYDILRESMVYDIGRIFNNSLQSLTYGMFRNRISNNDNNWASTLASYKPTLETLLAELGEKLK